jgi:gliding motility-associated-like protein
MDKRIGKYIGLLVFLCFFNGGFVVASHLMGGNLGYEYLGLQSNGKYRYKIKLTTYIDCGPSSEIPFAEYPLKVGIYSNDLLNPNANKTVIDSVLLTVDDTLVYIPFLPPGCTIGANTCIIRARYSGYIELDPSVNGYYLFYERCCRNSSILNLQPDGSNAFLAYIPPTNIINNTPDFLYPPIPFLCVNDTNTIFNTAVDLDGDSLVYEFATPFNGFGGSWDPHPHLPAPVIAWPVFPVDYVPGFTYDHPFSFFGEATLNSTNGVSTYFSLQQGTFVVCIVVKEYRNGTLISKTYRDLQLLFNNCPDNVAPVLVENLQKNYTVTQGDTLCFPISFQDPENDSVFINAHGNIFDPLLMDTPAVFSITEIDSNQASGQFCWTIPCTFDTGEYKFFMKSMDNGCPPKEKYEFYTIRIIPPIKPYLLGADTACKGTDSVLYRMVIDDHFQYSWNIAGGIITQNYGDSVVVNWGGNDSGYVHITVFTAAGCYLSSDSLTVTLIDVPVLYAMPADTVCLNDTLLLTATGIPAYYWYPESLLINPAEGNANAIIHHSGWFYVAGLPGELCPPSDSVYISALSLPLLIATSNHHSSCKGDTVQLFAQGANTYHWEPDQQVLFPDSANTYALSVQNGMFVVTGTDTNQCKNSDTVYIQLHSPPVITLAAIGEICLGDTAILTAGGGIYYSWSPNIFMEPDTGSVVEIFPVTNTTYYLEITDSNGCKTDTSLNVVVNIPPVASFTFDTMQINCGGTWIKFHNTSVGSNGAHWIFGNGTSSNDLDPQTRYPFGATYTVQLIASGPGGCSGSYMDTISTDDLANLAIIKPVNVFTPNNDGTNDLLDFSIPPEFLECTRIYVYDRWGVLMFASSGTDLSWSGTTAGKRVPEGVYYWIIELNGIPFKGFVHIFN